MKNLSKSKLWLASMIAGTIFSGSALALPTVTITDTYWGSDDHGHGDRIGGGKFEIYDMDVTLTGSILNVQVNTNYAGHTNLYGTAYGDLFLSSSWTPFGTGPEYVLDDNATGTKWTYGISIDGDVFDNSGNIDKNQSTRYQNNTGGTASLFQLNSLNNIDNVLISDDVLPPGSTFRNGQEVIVDTLSQTVSDTGVDGSWTISSGNFINFNIDLAGTNLLLGDEIALHWNMTCGNDTIEGAYDIASVPEPGLLLLLSTGLLGVVAAGRSKKA